MLLPKEVHVPEVMVKLEPLVPVQPDPVKLTTVAAIPVEAEKRVAVISASLNCMMRAGYITHVRGQCEQEIE